MSDQRRHPPRRRKKQENRAPITPGSDARLKKVFAGIGVPKKMPFVPDPFQVAAVEAMENGDCLVTAPTGSGKTWIAVEAIRKVFARGGRSWYASPLKALTNAKHTEFAQIFGSENIGILTGDRKENPDAPILVGTTEILRNQLYDAMHRGENIATDLVVLDEAHFLGDSDRGVVWEETMIYLPARIPLLMLSATIGNADQIARWLESIRGTRCSIVEETKRPVPLYPLFLHPSGTLFPMLSEEKQQEKPKLYKKVISFIKNSSGSRSGFGGHLPPMADILRVLEKYNLLPSIFFLKSRADCDNSVTMSAQHRVAEDPERRAGRLRRIEEYVEQVPHIANHRQMRILKERAMGAHHSGQLPAWKILIETLMTEGYLDAVFATSTVAAGVNFPARTIVFFNSDRFNGREFSPLNPTEFHQMTGRAGRRGMDKIGFAVAVPGKFMDLTYVGRLVHARATDVFSQININFSMTLNLLLSHQPEQIRQLLDKSFATFQFSATCNKKKKLPVSDSIHDTEHLWQDFLRHIDFLKQFEYVTENDKLTGDGIWAAQLRIDHPLMVAEGFRRNLFPQSDPAVLAAIMAAFVNERESDDTSIHPADIPNELEEALETVTDGLRPFAMEMMEAGFDVPVLFLRPAMTLYFWTKGMEWEDVLEFWDSAEGDLAKLMLRTADNLRHIRNIADVFPEAAASARKAIDVILRDPIVSSIEPEPV